MEQRRRNLANCGLFSNTYVRPCRFLGHGCVTAVADRDGSRARAHPEPSVPAPRAPLRPGRFSPARGHNVTSPRHLSRQAGRRRGMPQRNVGQAGTRPGVPPPRHGLRRAARVPLGLSRVGPVMDARPRPPAGRCGRAGSVSDEDGVDVVLPVLTVSSLPEVGPHPPEPLLPPPAPRNPLMPLPPHTRSQTPPTRPAACPRPIHAAATSRRCQGPGRAALCALRNPATRCRTPQGSGPDAARGHASNLPGSRHGCPRQLSLIRAAAAAWGGAPGGRGRRGRTRGRPRSRR